MIATAKTLTMRKLQGGLLDQNSLFRFIWEANAPAPVIRINFNGWKFSLICLDSFFWEDRHPLRFIKNSKDIQFFIIDLYILFSKLVSQIPHDKIFSLSCLLWIFSTYSSISIVRWTSTLNLHKRMECRILDTLSMTGVVAEGSTCFFDVKMRCFKSFMPD